MSELDPGTRSLLLGGRGWGITSSPNTSLSYKVAPSLKFTKPARKPLVSVLTPVRMEVHVELRLALSWQRACLNPPSSPGFHPQPCNQA